MSCNYVVREADEWRKRILHAILMRLSFDEQGVKEFVKHRGPFDHADPSKVVSGFRSF